MRFMKLCSKDLLRYEMGAMKSGVCESSDAVKKSKAIIQSTLKWANSYLKRKALWM